jgi:parvulin-like peptidyl-prolyl isomerase
MTGIILIRAVIVAWIVLSFFPYLYGEEINKVVAMVNSEVITAKDLNDYCKLVSYHLSPGEGDFKCRDRKSKEKALQRLIEDKLILDKAKKDKIEVSPSLIDNKLDEIKSAYPTLEDFEHSLIEKGFTITILKERIKDQYLVSNVLEKYVRPYVRVSPQEISQYYKIHQNNFYTPLKYILWIVKSKDEKLLQEIAKEIREKGFEKIKDKYENILIKIESEPKDLKEAIASALENLKEEDYLIKNIDGLGYFIYLERKINAHFSSLDVVKDEIYSYLREEKFNKRFKEWIDELKKEAVIKVYFP